MELALDVEGNSGSQQIDSRISRLVFGDKLHQTRITAHETKSLSNNQILGILLAMKSSTSILP